MPLLDLAPELFEQIIHIFVEQATLPDIFHSRGVCRTFAKYIDHELLETLPLDLFVDKSNHGQEEYGWAPFAFFHERIHILLVNQLQRSPVKQIRLSQASECIDTPNLTCFLDKVVENLVAEASSSACLEDLRGQYIQEIGRAVVATNGGMLQRVVIPPIIAIDCSTPLSGYINQLVPDATDMLAAAAAVGDIDAVRSFDESCQGIWRSENEPRLFRHAIGAAAAAGQFETLWYFTRQLLSWDDYTRQTMYARGFTSELHDIIIGVIKVGESDAATCLIELFYVEYPFETTQLRGNWLQVAIGTGCIKTLKDVIATKPLHDLADNYYEPYIFTGFWIACRNGHTDMIRHLFQQDRLRQCLLTKDATGCMPSAFHEGLNAALKEGHRGVSRTILAMDSNISAAEAFGAAMAARYGSKLIMTKLVLAHGFTVDLDTLQLISIFNGRVMVKGDLWKLGRPTSDEVKTAILLAWEVKKHLPIEELPNVSQLGRVCAKVTEDGFPGPLEPIFYAVADEVHGWIKHFLHGEQIARDFKRLKLDY